MNAVMTGFTAKKTFQFHINDIPLKIECSTENTRRAINDRLINLDELSKTMRRASCFMVEAGQDNIKDYNNLLRDVARISLKVRDILANGLPVKTVYLQSDERSHGKNATPKHPKLRFTHKDKKGNFLVIKHTDKQDVKKVTATYERHISKFTPFINAVEQCNRKHHLWGHNHAYGSDWVRTHEGGYERRDGKMNACAASLLLLLDKYVEGVTPDDKTALIGHVNKEMSEAEKKSEELLVEACKVTGTQKEKRTIGGQADVAGYLIPGQVNNYFVEETALRVYKVNGELLEYICVVNGRGDQGVGKDSLVARIYALHNDDMVTKQINTLRIG